MDGLVIDCATGNRRFVPQTDGEKIAATMRQFEAAEKARIEQERQQQRQSDLESLKTAQIAELRLILARLLA